MPLAQRLVAPLFLFFLLATLLSSSTSLAEGELPRESAEREATTTRRRSSATGDDASSSSPSSSPPPPPLFLPLSSFPSSTTVRGSTLRRHADHRVYSPLWLHHEDGTFYALDERGSFPGGEEDDASAHVAGAATRVEALPTASAAELVAASFSPSSTPWLPTPALLLEIPLPAHVHSTAVWMEVVAGAAAAVREAMDVERAEMVMHRQEQERRRRRRRRPGSFLLDLLFRPSAPSSSAPQPLFFLPDPSSGPHHRTPPVPLTVLLPNLDAKTWASSPGARWAREEALPIALEAAAEVALASGAAAAAAGDGGEQEQLPRQQSSSSSSPFFSLAYLTRDDLLVEQQHRLLSNSEKKKAHWTGFGAVVVPHGRATTPRRDAGFGGSGGGAGGGNGKGPPAAEPGAALAAAFRRRAWEAAGLPLEALSIHYSPLGRVERGCDPRGGGSGGGGGERERGAAGARDIVLVSEPSSSPSSSGNNNALANHEELASALERLASSLGLGARPALLTPSTPLAAAARVAARSAVVVGRTGPALAALAPLLAPGSGVVELVPPNWEWEGSHLLVRNMTRPLLFGPGGGGGSSKEKKKRGRASGVGSGGNGVGVLYSSWRPGELPSAPAAPRPLVYASEDDEIRFGRWSAGECAGDRECTEATARSLLRVDVAAVVDEVALLLAAPLSCDNNSDLSGFEDSAGSASEQENQENAKIM